MGRLFIKKEKKSERNYLVDDENNIARFISDIDLEKYVEDGEINLIVSPYNLDDDEYVFDGDIDKVLNYITKRGYKVNLEILAGMLINQFFESFDFDDKLYKKREFIENKDMVSFELAPFGKKINFSFFEVCKREMNSQIDRIINKTKDLSQIEKIAAGFMFSAFAFLQYDPSENKEEEKNYAYDIYTAMLYQNKAYVMCQVYTYLLEQVLKKNGIEYHSAMVTANESNHSVDTINVDDDKYNIHGNFMFDPTLSHEVFNYCIRSGRGIEGLPKVIPISFCVGEGSSLDKWKEYREYPEGLDDLDRLHLSSGYLDKQTIRTISDTAYFARWGEEFGFDIYVKGEKKKVGYKQ